MKNSVYWRIWPILTKGARGNHACEQTYEASEEVTRGEHVPDH